MPSTFSIKKLSYQDSKYSNKPTFEPSHVSAYSFGIPSLILLWERIENRLLMNITQNSEQQF